MSTIKDEIKAWADAKAETDAAFEDYRTALANLQAARDKTLNLADPVRRAVLRAGGELEIDGQRYFMRQARSGDWTSGEVVDREAIEAAPAKAKAGTVAAPTTTAGPKHSPVHKPATTPAEEIHAPSPATK